MAIPVTHLAHAGVTRGLHTDALNHTIGSAHVVHITGALYVQGYAPGVIGPVCLATTVDTERPACARMFLRV